MAKDNYRGDNFVKRLQSVLIENTCRIKSDFIIRQDSAYDCVIECDECIFAMSNRKYPDELIKLCVDKGFITKAEALDVTLSI
jgi:hypothetical protein